MEDFNNLDQNAGVAPFPVNIDGGNRVNSAFGYLDPVRDRLIVAGDALVERVLVHGSRAVGVAVRDGQRLAEIGASRVVLSAGAYGSPAILLRSGIGPAGELIAIGVTPALDLPGVGRNLHDQPCLEVGYEGGDGLIQQMERHQAETGWQPDEQVIAKFPSTGCRQGFDLHIYPVGGRIKDTSQWFWILGVACLTPLSRGSVRLTGPGLGDQLVIDHRYLSDSGGYDRARLAEGVERVREMAQAPELHRLLGRETRPGPEVSGRQAIERFLDHAAVHYYHPAGSCKMGPASDPDSVVDADGRVHGIEGLYVADASLMPAVISGNTNMPTAVIGEKIARSLLSLSYDDGPLGILRGGDRPRPTSGDPPQPGHPTEAKGGLPLGRASFVDRAPAAAIAGGSADGTRETIMTKQAGFKRRVRARMAKTGESYATARSRLLAGHPGATPDDSPLDWMPEALHISNGDATDVPGTGLARRVVYWRDVLHEGPVPEVAPAELRRIRADYLAGYQSVERAEAMREFTERDQALEANRDGEYVLWFEADLYDQLQIAEILARLAGLGVPAERVTLICIGEHAGIARFGGLGELTARQLRELPHTNACARLTPAALDLATRAWAAFCAPVPEGLGAIAAARRGELRFLGEAFDRLSREYPATRDGLSLTERRVLAAVADGAPDAGTAFVRAGSRETRPYMGDTTCFGRMDRMAEGPHPLLRLDPPGRPVERTTGVRLTGAGARVLAGQADQIALNGIDRWIGGVHLQGHHVPWRWDDGTETIIDLPGST